MGQQIIHNRSASGTGKSRTASSNPNLPERPPSSSSEIELTKNQGGLGQGITKTMAWETSTDVPQDTWSNASEQEGRSNVDFQPGTVALARTQVSH